MLTASPMLSFGNINRGATLISCTASVIINTITTFIDIVSLVLSVHRADSITLPHSAITDN
ncbi:hypothetical protein GQ42DRAFT_164074 [Ramicandelaber brevisporus]|nr:hypothetical protein GQ42DRAFT_164074 [Ramicandelaber brevisporus]